MSKGINIVLSADRETIKELNTLCKLERYYNDKTSICKYIKKAFEIEESSNDVITHNINIELTENDYNKLKDIADYYRTPIEEEFKILSSAFINTYYDKMPRLQIDTNSVDKKRLEDEGKINE